MIFKYLVILANWMSMNWFLSLLENNLLGFESGEAIAILDNQFSSRLMGFCKILCVPSALSFLCEY